MSRSRSRPTTKPMPLGPRIGRASLSPVAWPPDPTEAPGPGPRHRPRRHPPPRLTRDNWNVLSRVRGEERILTAIPQTWGRLVQGGLVTGAAPTDNRGPASMKPEPLVEDIQNYALDIVDTVREPLLILDTTLRVRFANRAF